MKIEINQKLVDKLCEELEIAEVPILVLPTDTDKENAIARCVIVYDHQKRRIDKAHIEIYADKFRSNSFYYRWLLVSSIIHEYRHIHQFTHWNVMKIRMECLLPYKKRPVEIDANLFARRSLLKYWRIAKIRKEYPSHLPQESHRPQVSHAVLARYQAEEMD